MNKRFIIAPLGTFGHLAACGSNGTDAGAGTDAAASNDTAAVKATPICTGPAVEACVLAVDGLPFVLTAVAVTDGASTARVTHPAPGRVCLSGTLADAGAGSANWGVILGLPIAERSADRTRILSPFNAEQLGITQFQFTIERPPATGVRPAITQVAKLECPDDPGSCLTIINLRDETGAQALITTTRTMTVPLSTSAQAPSDAPQLPMDLTRMNGVQFGAGALQGTNLDYDFCIHDLKFLGADSKEIVPLR